MYRDLRNSFRSAVEHSPCKKCVLISFRNLLHVYIYTSSVCLKIVGHSDPITPCCRISIQIRIRRAVKSVQIRLRRAVESIDQITPCCRIFIQIRLRRAVKSVQIRLRRAVESIDHITPCCRISIQIRPRGYKTFSSTNSYSKSYSVLQIILVLKKSRL